MITDTLTIVLDGEVPLAEFARTIESFYELVKALSDEVGTPDLDWVLDDLQVSSAFATIRAPHDPQSAERVINAYAEVGHALEVDGPMEFSPRVRSAARKVVSIRDPRVRSVRFETRLRDATVKISPSKPVELPPAEEAQIQVEQINVTGPIPVPRQVSPRPTLSVALPPSLGGIQGRVQALSNRGGLRFTVYDLLYDKAIGCYIAEGKEELLRNIWGRLAVIEGMITRDPINGRPLSIRQVSDITMLPDPRGAREYEDARGAVTSLTGLSPEDAIRKVRDA
ncbi:MAG: hypothetical protein ABI833_22865 [Acidobacteriota bacterium]